MTTDTDHFQRRQLQGLAVQRRCIRNRHAELVAAQASRNIRMRPGIHIGIHPQRHRRDHARRRGKFRQTPQLGGRFHIKTADADRERARDFRIRLGDAGKNHAGRCTTGAQDAFQLAAGDNIKTRARFSKEAQQSQIAVGLHRIIQRHLPLKTVRVIGAQCRTHRRRAVHIQRRAEGVCQRRERHPVHTAALVHPGKKLSAHQTPPAVQANKAAPSARNPQTKSLQ